MQHETLTLRYLRSRQTFCSGPFYRCQRIEALTVFFTNMDGVELPAHFTRNKPLLRTYVTDMQYNSSDDVFSPMDKLVTSSILWKVFQSSNTTDAKKRKENHCFPARNVPLTATIPVMGIHSLEPSENILGLLRAGKRSKCACTSDAIRDASGLELGEESISVHKYQQDPLSASASLQKKNNSHRTRNYSKSLVNRADRLNHHVT